MVDQSTFKIRSCITRELKGHTVRKGGLIGGFGATSLLLGTLFLPKSWSPVIFLVSLVFIVIGLYPYRRLTLLESKPHTLAIEGALLHFSRSGKSLFKIPLSTIEQTQYVEKDHLYGVTIKLKRPIENKVVVTDQRFKFDAFATDSATRFEGCDLFLPYFSKRAHQELKDQFFP